MFTGIIKEIGVVTSIVRSGETIVLTIAVSSMPADTKIGDSIAIDGICLTVVKKDGDTFSVEAVEETLQRTTLGAYREGTVVNIEYSLRISDRLGGHFVQGHIDAIGTIQSIQDLGGSALYTIAIPQEIAPFCVEKGSIAIDGISLTIARLEGNTITLSVIPHTRKATTIGKKAHGDMVNIEADIIGKYVQKFIAGYQKPRGITEAFLRDTGFIE